MQREYEKHKTTMSLLSVFENKIFTKDLQFYQLFGNEQIYENATALQNHESPNDEIRETDEINEITSENCSMSPTSYFEVKEYKYCDKSIPIDLTKDQFSLYGTVENLFKHTMKKKNKLVLNHKVIVEMTEEIGDAFRLISSYFLNK